MNAQPWQASYAEVRALRENEWDPVTWKGDFGVDELENLEPQGPLNSRGGQELLTIPGQREGASSLLETLQRPHWRQGPHGGHPPPDLPLLCFIAPRSGQYVLAGKGKAYPGGSRGSWVREGRTWSWADEISWVENVPWWGGVFWLPVLMWARTTP